MASYSEYDRFVSFVKTEGLAHTSKFNVILPPLGEGDTTEVSMQCEIASLPGINVMTSEIRTFGESTEYSYGITYPPVTLSFYVSNKFDTKSYFETWQNLTFDRATRCPGFYRDYVKPVTIILSSKEGSDIHKVVLHEAFPKTIQDISLSYGDASPMRISVTLQYKWWSFNEGDSSAGSAAEDESSGLFSDLLGGGGIGGLLGNVFGGGDLKGIEEVIGDFGGDLGAKLSSFGPKMGSDILKAANKAAFAMPALSVPGLPNLGGDLSKQAAALGSDFGTFGKSLGDLGKNITGAVAGPISAIAGSVTSISSTLNSIDALARTVGIDTGLNKITGRLNEVSGKLAITSQLNGIPGALQSVGANMQGIQTSLSVLTKRLEQVPGATVKMAETLEGLGAQIGINGSHVSNAGSAISDI